MSKENLETKLKIFNFIEKNSWFELDGYVVEHYSDTNTLNFQTRESGQCGYEEAGQEDIKEANRLKTELLKVFKEDIEQVEIDICDEWVFLNVEVID